MGFSRKKILASSLTSVGNGSITETDHGITSRSSRKRNRHWLISIIGYLSRDGSAITTGLGAIIAIKSNGNDTTKRSHHENK